MRRFHNTRPLGYRGVPAGLGTWAEWLRLLPLAAPGAPVRNARGEIVVPSDDEHLAAVVAIDVGDDQRSADVLLRLFAEWRWFSNESRMLFLSDSKLELPLEKWTAGERLEPGPTGPRWVRRAAPRPKLDRRVFGDYLDSVLARSDGPALLSQSTAVAPEQLAPGDFFLHPGRPAEVVLVLDVATSTSGERVMMLAQALNPAENLHVLRPSRDTVWFPVRTKQPLRLPRARPYLWRNLRRFERLFSPPKVACKGSLCPQYLQGLGTQAP
jgi:hypothetical protein